MNKSLKYILSGTVIISIGALWFNSLASPFGYKSGQDDIDSLFGDTLVNVKAQGPQFKLKDESAYPVGDLKQPEGIQLKQPSNIKTNVEYDPVSRQYIFTNKIGKTDYRRPSTMNMKEYNKYEMKRTIRNYWITQANGGKSPDQRGYNPSINLGSKAFDKIFGSSTINIVPQGQAELIFGVDINTTNNPLVYVDQRTVPSFNFEEKIQMNVTGTIGERLKLGISYNTEASFEFENKTKLEYSGDEDDIIKKIEAGDVTMPLPGSLISGSHSLFGIKTEMQFGKLYVTSVLSQQKGQSQEMKVQGGAQVTDFEIPVDEYEANKHFFLAHTFREDYNKAHLYLPMVSSSVNITKIEIWITNKKGKYGDMRYIVAFTDLGETKDSALSNHNVTINPGAKFADNESNTLYKTVAPLVQKLNDDPSALKNGASLNEGKDYEYLRNACKLSENEYSYNPELGYISLNTALNADEILAVAYEYKISDGTSHKVGQFASENTSSEPLVLKLLKGTNLSPRYKTWDLMMKNIYSLGAYDISRDEFYLNILYHSDAKGTDINYLDENTNANSNDKVILLRLFDFDKVNSQMQPEPDGVFDFLDGITIDKRYGRIIFPSVEPFGNALKSKLQSLRVNPNKYIYQELYDSTLTKARLVEEKNKFKLKGTYKSASSSEIYLNASNIPQGSVKVTQGGIELRENIDYVVDYSMGTVKIINSGLMASGQPIKVSLENNSMFNIQTKTLVGTHLDYKFSDDFNIGATIIHLNERPLTKKVNIGDEPISNTMLGLNSSFKTNSQLLTTLIDKLPLIQTKETSSVMLSGEFAQLVPGSSKAIGKNGVAYIDDFEATETKYDLTSPQFWKLASTPNSIFPEASLIDNTEYGRNRAKLSWFNIDRSLLEVDENTPAPIKNDPNSRSSHYVREIFEQELFPNSDPQYNQPTQIEVMNLTYYPNKKGPYNFDTKINPDGTLTNPSKRWGGIMHDITTTDFEAANIAYIEFWLMDPFVEDSSNTGGEMYLNLGNISEDILKDGKMAFEQGMPTQNEVQQSDTTVWGLVSRKQLINNSFSPNNSDRPSQDVGLDGLSDDGEKNFSKFKDYIDTISNILTDNNSPLISDPSQDNFHYFLGSDYDNEKRGIIDRYEDFNGMEGNSPVLTNEPRAATSIPDMEEINNDYTMSTNESFFEYRLELKPEQMRVGNNFITDVREVRNIKFPNNKTSSVKWYQFKIPVNEYQKMWGDIEDFKSIRFMRMYLTGFDKQTMLRMAKFSLVRDEWRKYEGSMEQGSDCISGSTTNASLDIQAVNIEENANRKPVNYVLPPTIDRVIDPSQEQLRQLNEQSMVLRVTDISDGDARAAFKKVNLDMRQYKKLQMFAHCEPLQNRPLNNDDLAVFIRIGTDYKDNFYEYEVPMTITPIDGSVTTTADNVWPGENNFNIDLELFQRLKQHRNDAGVPLQTVYTEKDGKKNRMSICGNPSLSNIRTIMIGVRNPGNRPNYTNDALPKSAEIWVNELRLTDFSNKGGWAANARVQFKLADFGNVRVSGSTIQPGFGSIESKVNDREKNTTNQFDVVTDLELGKFFPQKTQVKIPAYASYSKSVVSPEFNPFDQDIPLKASLDGKSQEVKDSILRIAEDFTERRSFNFTNVKINKTSKKPKLYNIANFSVSYGYNDLYSRTPTIARNWNYHHEGSFNYIFNNRPKNIMPFRKVSFLNKKAFRIIKDINFYYSPMSIAFRTNMDRDYREMEFRNIGSKGINLPPTIEKKFTWNRTYNVKYDLSRGLKVDFSANNYSIINEPTANNNLTEKQNQRIWPQILKGGTTMNYEHKINVNYNVPLDKLPLVNWISLNSRYSTNYEWTYQPTFQDTANSITHKLGNDITNSRNIQLNGNANISNIFNKIRFINDLTSEKSKRGKLKKTVTFEKKYYSLKAGEPKSISHQLGTVEVTVIVKDSSGNEVKGKMEVISSNRVAFTPDRDIKNANVRVDGKIETGENIFLVLARNTIRLITGLKSISVSYNQLEGTTLPGYLTGRSKETEYLGCTLDDGKIAPGIPFILGFQDNNILNKMHNNGWLTRDTLFNTPMLMSYSNSLTFQLNYEPFKGLKINLNANRSRSKNTKTNFLDIDENSIYIDRKPTKGGNFSMTIISLFSFEKLSKDSTYVSDVYRTFTQYREDIRIKLDEKARRENPYYSTQIPTIDSTGYGINSQQVLIPAFLAAYGGYGLSNTPLELIPAWKYIRPNWRINYDGLTNISFINNYFRSITLSHSYVSTYNIGSFTSNLGFNPAPDSMFINRDLMNNFVPEYDVSSVSITEQFSPLIGIDMTWKNNLTTRFEFKKSRILSLSFSNNSLSETRGTEYVIGAGYRFEEMPLKFITLSGQQSNVKSGLNLRADLSIRDDYTLIRRFENESSDITAGLRTMNITFNADYALSDKLNLNFFYKRFLNDPHISSSSRTVNTNIGFSLRFTLAQ